MVEAEEGGASLGRIVSPAQRCRLGLPAAVEQMRAGLAASIRTTSPIPLETETVTGMEGVMAGAMAVVMEGSNVRDKTRETRSQSDVRGRCSWSWPGLGLVVCYGFGVVAVLGVYQEVDVHHVLLVNQCVLPV